ncbi:MAG: cytochrome c biogenesis protein ResB [Dehalococcoidales bacterium]|nr:cytochrome c biogenesis protein ResB [Dehalococcoidales bacterium]
MKTAKETKRQEQSKFGNVIKWIWRQFSSVRLAVILILVITALSLLGALLIQVPQSAAGDPQYYNYWLETIARPKLGGWASFFSALGLFDVFRSPWFVIVGSMLMMNIFVCTINRWNSIRAGIKGTAITQNESFYMSGSATAELPVSDLKPDLAAEQLRKVLHTRGYRTRMETGDENRYISADKNRYYRLGTFISHFSLILFVLAFITGNYYGFSDTSFTVAEGTGRDIGHDTGLILYLDTFTAEYYESGMPKNYSSDVILYEDGKIIEETRIRVNYPLAYKGVKIYQSYFGPAAAIQVHDDSGNTIFDDNVALNSSFAVEGIRYYEGYFYLPQTGHTVRLIVPSENNEMSMIPVGQIAVDLRSGDAQVDLKLVELGTPRMISGLSFTYNGDLEYSGFQIRKDPTNLLIWISSILFILGICAVFYFPYRQAWILVKPEDSGSRICVKTPSSRMGRNDAEITALVECIEEGITDIPDKGEHS